LSKIQSNYIYGGTSDECGGVKPNEDYFTFKVLEPDTLLMVIADGMGSKPSTLQPAAIASQKAAETVERLFKTDKETFLNNPTMMLKEAIHVANNVLGAFKISNEEQHSGFAASMTLVFVYKPDNTAGQPSASRNFCYAQVGNCRINLLRIMKDGSPRIMQITTDQTKAMELFNDGIITADEYHGHPDRFVLTSCVGVVSNPEIFTYEGKLKENDILIITTDGIHYTIAPEPMAEIVLQAANWEEATKALIKGAKMEKAADNATAIFFLNPPAK